MKKNLLFIMLLSLTAITAMAGRENLATARQQAGRFLAERMAASRGVQQSFIPQMELAQQACGCYVFNATDGNGWAIVSESKENHPVLAYSLEGCYRPEEGDGPIHSLLKMYGQSDSTVGVNEGLQDIAPLLATKWGECSPYNKLMPVFTSMGGDNSIQASTGAAVTAIAQVLNYYQWPVEVEAVQHDSLGWLPPATIDWPLMQETYQEGDNTANAWEVAKLMEYIGHAVNATYTPDATVVWSNRITASLRDYFGYEPAYSNFYFYDKNKNAWNYDAGDLLNGELQESRPVLLFIALSDYTTVVVADGYMQGGFYHLNWGLNGLYNGYYSLPDGIRNDENDDADKYVAIAMCTVRKSGADDSTMSAQDDSDYLPFVKEGKRWNVFRSDFETGCHLEQYMLMNEEIVKDGKAYMKMYRSEDDLDVVYDTGLFREEDRKVYRFDTERQEEHLLFDYSLKEGDTYDTYSYDEQRIVTYKVLSVSDYLEGPEVIRYGYDEEGNLITHHRYLKKWTVCRTDDEYLQRTWIEGVGSLEGPLGNLRDVVLPGMSKDYLAFVEYLDGDLYLPFSFYDTLNGQMYGCDLPTGEADHSWDDLHHQLTYELEGDRLHVYGKAYTNCGPNNYAYFIEKPTDDPLIHKLHFEIQEAQPTMDCMSLHATDFYVSGFDPDLNYIIVDNQGEEHQVINKIAQIAYRPMIEEGKVWKVGAFNSGNPVQVIGYFYLDGDTIIDGKTCKQMMLRQYISHDFPYYDLISPQDNSLSYVGAWYEEDQKVYKYDSINNQFKLMYDFSIEANGTLEIDNFQYVIGPRQTGGLKAFKGVYRDVMWCEDGEQRGHSATWLEGVGDIYGPTTSVTNGYVDPMGFLMSCTVGDEVIYFNDDYEDGATPAETRKRFDFTHTIKTKPQAPRRAMGTRSSSSTEVEPTLYGEYNNLQLGINLDPLDDAYQVRITDETGKTVYEKTVNAGNIVGLNVDISAYAEGRYTVTVENSQEVFTGEFETLTAGISLTPALSQGEGTIYNLQGQRISTLQKGLNIVNGQKVYVK